MSATHTSHPLPTPICETPGDEGAMEYGTLRAALVGLHAYDSGAVDSGIRDEALRARCGAQLRSLSAGERRLLLGRMTRELWLTEEAMAQGYGPEDAGAFITWLDDQRWLL